MRILLSFLLIIVSHQGLGNVTQSIKTTPLIVVSIDGLRPDAVKMSKPTNLWHLINNGNYFENSTTIDLSLTLPSHTSMLTGLNYTNHNITWNDYMPSKGTVKFPTFLELAKNKKFSTAMFVSKDKFHHLHRANSVDYFELTSKNGESIATAFENYLKINKLPDVTFLHIPDPDVAGHAHMWMSQAYHDAVKSADKALGRIIEAVKNIDKNFTIIVSADHGGSFFGHLAPVPANRKTPLIVVGPHIKPDKTIYKQVKIYDIAATVLKLLEIEIPDDFDGEALPLVFKDKD